MSKKILEQVLEHILNKEEDKAQELLHSFFVEKGRSIYEGLIESDDVSEEEVLETEELDNDAQEDFGDDISAAKEDIASEEMFSEEGDEDELDFGDGEEGDEEGPTGPDDANSGDTEDQIDDAVLDVEDALDELKSLFAQLKDEQGGGDDDMAKDMGDMEMGPEEETEESFQFEDADELDESADLIAVAKPAGGDNGSNTRSPVAANSGAKGMAAKPFKLGGSDAGKGGTQGGLLNPTTKEDNAGNVNTTGNKKAPSLSAVAKPAKAEAAGNTRSPIAGR